MALAILDQLQGAELNPQSVFAGASKGLEDTKNQVKGKFGGVNVGIEDLSGITKTFEQETSGLQNGQQSGVKALQSPIDVSELKTEINNRLGTLSSINVDNLSQIIPANPGASQLQETVKNLKVNDTLKSLTDSITGGQNFAEIKVADVATPFDEFQTFLANAGALPSRILDALIKVFKKFLDKISNPDEWLETLSSETLTNLFIEQIQDLGNSLPSQAIAAIEAEVNRQTKILVDYQDFLEKYNLKNTDREKITKHRSEIKKWTREIQSSHQKIDQTLKKLDNFQIVAFQSATATLPKDAMKEATRVSLFGDIFAAIQNFLDKLKSRIADVVKKLTGFIEKLEDLIKQAIAKVTDITNGIVEKISETIAQANSALTKVKEYVKNAIEKLENFINDACNKSGDVVAPLKKVCNSLSGSAIKNIDQVANTIDEGTKKIKGSLQEFNSFMQTNLNREKLEKDIKEFLDKVMSFLQSESIGKAIKAAEEGINKAVTALNNVSLKPAFKSAVDKSESLETKFKGMDVSKMGTAQKVALKVGVTVIKQVDVPGIVNPELNNAFKSVVDPLAGLVTSIQGETEKVYEKIQSFKPGTLIDQWLSPYINSLTDELQKYQPSIILKDVKQMYLEMVDKLDILDPNQLIVLLDALYKKLEDLFKTLDPTSLLEFLNERKAAFVTMLEEFKTEGIPKLITKVTDAIGDAEKLLGGLGLDSILKADFWETIEQILSLDMDTKIHAVDDIKQKIIEKINNIQDEKVKAELIRLKTAIATYTDNPQNAIANVETSLKNSLTIYQQKYDNCQTQWQKTKDKFETESKRLDTLSQPINYEYHFLNLKETCQNLSTTLHTGIVTLEAVSTGEQLAQELLKEIATRREKLVEPTKAELKTLTDTLKKCNENDILQDFKKIIPDELELELIAPIKKILASVKEILAEPKKIIEKVRGILERLKNVPKEIAAIFTKVTKDIGKSLQVAVENLIQEVSTFNFDFIQEVYKKIKNTIESLLPSQILNGFFDASDFQNKPEVFIQLLQKQENPLTKRIWDDYLDNATRKLFNTNQTGEGVQKALMTVMNKLLRKKEFYQESFVEQDKLTKEAQSLIAKKDPLKPEELIRLNRLVLETLFPEYISRSLQSVFPYLKSQLQRLYPQAIIDELDKTHATLIETLQGIPKAIGGALDKKYEELVKLYETAIQDKIRQIFRELLKKLYSLQGELDLGLDDLGDAFNNLIAAVPV
ncbi:hypothetical protein [Nostoc sp. ChiQUE01b]|uniref:hypothetical protein n=1 Tax=Nostoc sp. ChiQUE01b TaxID=3075376 RepID=UPI002AD22199|nr:hypothetical protein [Nostoc sp. ChiQUE01b]MDZ8263310.1 hypothetical protein [Nostoc sp. ChiQUE01b]